MGDQSDAKANERKNKVNQLFADAKRGHPEDIERLIKRHGAKDIMRIRDGNGDSLLHAAALYGQTGIAKILLDNAFEVDIRGYLGRTALLNAACKGQTKMIVQLVNHGAKLDVRSYAPDDNSCALHLAASFGHVEAADLLLEMMPAMINWPDKDGDRAIHRAALMGNVDFVQFLVRKGANLEDKGQYARTPFLCAVCKGSRDVVMKIVEMGANIHSVSDKEDGEGSAIHLACEFGHVDIISYLLSIYPAFMNMRDSNDNLPINTSALSGRKESIEFLLQRNGNLEARGFNGRTPLLNAAGKGDEGMVKFLIDLKADVSVRSGPDDDEAMAIHIAAAFGSVEVLTVLLDAFPGFKEIPNSRKDLPLNVAALTDQVAAVRLLLERGANLEARGFQGRTPLLTASAAGNVATVECLLKKGAKVSAQTDEEACADTALHLAALFGHKTVVELLVRVRSSLLMMQNACGDIPQQRAQSQGHHDVVDFLKEKKSARLDL